MFVFVREWEFLINLHATIKWFYYMLFASGCTQVRLAMCAIESSSVNLISFFTYESCWLWENHFLFNIMHLCYVVFLPVLPKWMHTNVPYVFVNAVLLICTIICIIYSFCVVFFFRCVLHYILH